jgi:ribonuclease R
MKFNIDEKGQTHRSLCQVGHPIQPIDRRIHVARQPYRRHPHRSVRRPKTFVYRVHDLPDAEKLEDLMQFIKRFGYKIKASGSKTEVAKSINNLLDQGGRVKARRTSLKP